MADFSEQLAGRGFNSPLRFEAAIDDCEVVGKIPSDLNGAFYRTGGEWYYPPKFPDDAPLNADGYVSSFRIKNGKVDFKGRWVKTHRFQKQHEARRQLYGYYRNPYTDDPSVRDPQHPNLRTVANTAPVIHAGKLFALKEDGLPHQIDPNTLDTVGPWDFHGQWKSQTFSAHPKLDPMSGEMIAFGYEATGLASDDLYIYSIDPSGRVRHEIRTKVPYVSIIHDMAVTHRHVVIPFSNYVTSAERLQAGKIHWGWDATKPGYIGVVPREGTGKDMRWFKGPSRCMMHTFNAHSEGNKVILYAPFWDTNFFPFFPNVDGTPADPSKFKAFIRKITLDLDSSSDEWHEEILWPMQVNDLGKVDPRTMTLESRYLYTAYIDPDRPYDRAKAGPSAPARMTNCYGRFDVATKKIDTYFAGKTHSLQECTFVPRGTSEGEGYLIGIASNYAEQRSELIIADAQRLGEGDIARVILPFRLSQQVHGVWASAKELPLT
ncbi:MAG TPA: carotenoid oxygenase family protein [Steroidobacteraceae bacterium]|jgi:carotenoid cleavage dioxygenase